MKINRTGTILIITVIILSISGCSTLQEKNKTYTGTDAWSKIPEILSRIIPPVFPDKDFNITEYGADASGKIDSTDAIKKAITVCNASGGGRVVVPAGTFLTGAVYLKSNVNLFISQGATLLFTHDYSKYLPAVYTRFEGIECYNYSPFIYAYEETNIAITGTGTLNGNADTAHWWNWKNDGYADRQNLFAMGEKGVPVKERIFGGGHMLRTNFIQPYRCKNILIEGVTILQSPMWEINPVLCTNVTIKNVIVNSHGLNNDGCDPECSRDVLIKDCIFNTGDDCIAIKSGRNNDGRRVGVPSENIIIQGVKCIDGHGAITMGSENSGDIRNVFAENCGFSSPNLDIAIRLKTNSVRGGIIENLYFRNITVGTVGNAVIHATMNYEEGDTGKFTPIIRNIDITNLTSSKSKYVMYLEGYKRSNIENVKLKDCAFNGSEYQKILINVSKLEMINVTINGIKQ